MNKLYKALPLVALIALTGCNSPYKSTEIIAEPAAMQNKAIVITRMIHPLPGTNLFGNKVELPVLSFWTRIDNTTGEQKTRYRFFKNGLFNDKTGHHEHMIEPGTYRLNELSYTRDYGRTIVTTTLKADKLFDITFTANPGEVVYIGDIEVSTSNNVKQIDNYDNAVNFFKTEHPEINKPVEKRLIKGLDEMENLKQFLAKTIKENADKKNKENKK